MRFDELFELAGIEPEAISGPDTLVGTLNSDTRSLKAGEVFVAMPSARTDTHALFAEAVAKGAAGLIAHSEEGFKHGVMLGPTAFVLPEQFNEALWRLAKVSFGDPSASMKVLGVTGTNGKTTVAWLVRHAMRELGLKAGYLGTLGLMANGLPDREIGNTTPFVVNVNRMVAELRDAGVEGIAIEVSSHALDQRRADGIALDAGVFTNLTQDHLDYHVTMEAYAEAKWRLFSDLPAQSSKRFVAAFNVDDPVGRRWSEQFQGEQIPFGRSASGLKLVSADVRVDGLTLDVLFNDQPAQIQSRLGGVFNAENVLAACAGGLALGFELEAVAWALSSAEPVPGRFEAVPNDSGIGILIDYAHTPDALEKLLDSVRALGPKRVITVFGCGGDRDRTKRPKMARAASERSDLTIATSDNPRTEDPQAILDEVVSGIVLGREAVAILDRGEAIAYALKQAAPGDVVVIAGKGHENYQIIGTTKFPMDDRELAREGLMNR